MGQARRLAVAVSIPLATFCVQFAFRDAIGPSAWFLFYPAVFFSALLTDRAGGIVATLLSATLGWFFFVEPRFSFAVGEPGSLVSLLVFAASGVAFSLFSQRLRDLDRRRMAAEAEDRLRAERAAGARRQHEQVQAARVRLMERAATLSLHDLLVATLDEIGALTGSPIGFCHFLEADQKTLSLQAWSTPTTRDYCRAEGAGTHYHLDEAGVWADAARLRRAVVHNDYATLSGKRGLPEGHAALVRELVVPVFREGRVVAILGVGNKATPYDDADLGTVSELADLAWDFARIRRAEEALRESEERWKFALEAAGDGVWDRNLETGAVTYSRRWKEILGYADGDIGDRFDEWDGRIHPDDRAGALAPMAACAAGTAPDFTLEQRLRGRDGRWVWVLVRGRTVRHGPDGQPLRMIGTMTDITARKEAELQVSFLAHHDRLTGLPNRLLFLDRLAQAISQARRSGRCVAVLFVDLDGFKAVNDTVGHAGGDFVLKAAAQRFLSCVRNVDTVARVGGDEFLLVLGALRAPAEAAMVAGRLLEAMVPPIALPGGRECSVGTSIGIAVYPDHGAEMDTLIAAADAAMYRSKEAGGHRCTWWEDTMPLGAKPVDDWVQLDPSHVTGIATIDAQHRELARLVNDVNRAVRERVDDALLERRFVALADYARLHFDTEHALMERYGYPGRENHDAIHERLLADLGNFRARFSSGGELFVLQWIKDWLVGHIAGEDLPLGAFLREKMPPA